MFKKILFIAVTTLMLASLSFAENKQSSSSTMGNSDGLLGISLDLNTMKEWNLIFNVNDRIGVVGILGFDYYDDDNDDDDNDGHDKDSHFDFIVGAGVIFFVTKQLLPISLEADLKYSTADWVDLNFMMDLALPVLPHFSLVGKAGIDINIGTEDPHPLEISPITKISAVWFFL